MAKENNADMDIITTFGGRSKITPKVSSRIFEFYISGTITGPEDYVEDFDTIRHAQPDDTIKIYLNTYGGDLFTAIQFLRVLSDTEALVVCSVEGACMSAGTMLFLAADVFEVTPHSVFMFHNYSGGTFGKGGEQFDQIQHERKWSERLLKELYEDFLTPLEIKALLDNKDLWMDVDEVADRMNKRIKVRQEQAEEIEATKAEIELPEATKAKTKKTKQ